MNFSNDLLKMFSFIKAVCDTVFDMINAVNDIYPD